ncbi:unnamed protein product [Sphenostylis stenocarpa]|uniref:Uncharacterized protein n=1 Tax=Sphenostylis stenocarpa TaxID=92480 RepID=A0AA86VDC4_9FABA|nr:unnamed protein product [Sphenostylis stenocarpa]
MLDQLSHLFTLMNSISTDCSQCGYVTIRAKGYLLDATAFETLVVCYACLDFLTETHSWSLTIAFLSSQGARVSVNVEWQAKELNSQQCLGKSACTRCK